jgi:predicted TIM-barrel fold metal-dependent hydrolase
MVDRLDHALTHEIDIHASAAQRGDVILRGADRRCEIGPQCLGSLPSSQVVFGTDFPFLTAKATAAELRATELFTATDLQAIERGNAERLMPKYRT